MTLSPLMFPLALAPFFRQDFILPSKRSVMRPVGDAGQATDLVYPRTVRDLSGIAENQTVTEAAATQVSMDISVWIVGRVEFGRGVLRWATGQRRRPTTPSSLEG